MDTERTPLSERLRKEFWTKERIRAVYLDFLVTPIRDLRFCVPDDARECLIRDLMSGLGIKANIENMRLCHLVFLLLCRESSKSDSIDHEMFTLSLLDTTAREGDVQSRWMEIPLSDLADALTKSQSSSQYPEEEDWLFSEEEQEAEDFFPREFRRIAETLGKDASMGTALRRLCACGQALRNIQNLSEAGIDDAIGAFGSILSRVVLHPCELLLGDRYELLCIQQY